MIIKKDNTTRREFKGVDFELMATGTKIMVTKMNYQAGDKVPEHSHYNEQAGYIVSGEIRLTFGKYDEILSSGDSYVIPGNTAHCVEVLKPGEVIDMFTPPREEYI